MTHGMAVYVTYGDGPRAGHWWTGWCTVTPLIESADDYEALLRAVGVIE